MANDPIECFFFSEEERQRIHEEWRERVKGVDMGDEEYKRRPEERIPLGAIYYAPWWWDPKDGKLNRESHLNKFYEEVSDQRAPIFIETPGGAFSPDMKSSNGPGWTLTGEIPKITVSPSIGMMNPDGGWRYHAWLKDGILTDA